MLVKHVKAREGYRRSTMCFINGTYERSSELPGRTRWQTRTNWNEPDKGGCKTSYRREDIPVYGTRPQDGTRTPSSRRNTLDTSRW